MDDTEPASDPKKQQPYSAMLKKISANYSNTIRNTATGVLNPPPCLRGDGISTRLWSMTDWDDRYQEGDMPWEKGQAAPPLVELLEEIEPEVWGSGPVLVPGCGYGHDVRKLARELKIPVVGVDISATAVERAREFARVGQEEFVLGNFLDPAWRAGREFSAIWEHTCFCAINPSDRGCYAAAAAACLADGGLLAGVFFLTPFDLGEEQQGPPFGVTLSELDGWFLPYFERVDGWVPYRSFPGREEREWIGLFRKLAHA